MIGKNNKDEVTNTLFYQKLGDRALQFPTRSQRINKTQSSPGNLPNKL
jgi:hypothetical protein